MLFGIKNNKKLKTDIKHVERLSEAVVNLNVVCALEFRAANARGESIECKFDFDGPKIEQMPHSRWGIFVAVPQRSQPNKKKNSKCWSAAMASEIMEPT